jgi:hypothetical protein
VLHIHPWEELLEQRDGGREVKMGRSDRSRRKSLRKSTGLIHPWEELLEQRDGGREVKMGRSDRSRWKSLRKSTRLAE